MTEAQEKPKQLSRRTHGGALPDNESIASNYCPAIDHLAVAASSLFERFSCGGGDIRALTAMRDPGLSEAIQAAGGVSELARRIGISQPSVSNWDKVPAERVLAVEAATGVDRTVLRPDLYQRAPMAGDVDEVDVARAQEYALLATLLVRAPDAALLERLARTARRRDAARRRACRSRRSRGAHDVPSKSSANTSICSSGSDAANCCPTARIISPASCTSVRWRGCATISPRFGIERAEGNYEPEDHAATLCEIMAGLAGGRLRAPDGSRAQTVRETYGAVDRPLLRRSGARRTRRISTAASARSAACSWTSKRKPSRCRRETAARNERPRRKSR